MSKTVTRPLKAFLCHASGDKPAVREMYKRLVFEGVDAWLDKEKLLPGQDWRVEIPKAVQEADVVIVFLSKNSITKEGYVQKEIKIALDIAEEKPEGTIFLIPARLEECLVPETVEPLAVGGFVRGQWLYPVAAFVEITRQGGGSHRRTGILSGIGQGNCADGWNNSTPKDLPPFTPKSGTGLAGVFTPSSANIPIIKMRRKNWRRRRSKETWRGCMPRRSRNTKPKTGRRRFNHWKTFCKRHRNTRTPRNCSGTRKSKNG